MSSRLPTRASPELAVFASGFASMGLEILAGRLLAPSFGSSLYVWGSIIGVFLTALSAGYAVGGRRAATGANRRALVTLLTGSAAFVALLVVGDDTILALTEAVPVPTRYAPILPVAVLFGPLTFALGFVSPYVAELSVAESHGSASGRVYAVGTVGSIVGAFGTTFVLVPAFEIRVIEAFFAVFLLGAAVFVAEFTPANIGRIVAATLLLVASVGLSAPGVAATGNVVYEDQSAYSEIRVVDEGGVRTLHLDGARHSATYVDGRAGYVWTYPRYAHLSMLMQDDVDRVLFVGGGGFTMPQRFHEEYPNVTVDVVEIDPAVVVTAKRYFGLEESARMNVHVGDGRQFLQETNHTYDVIVLDAYRSDKVPFHLTTVEFMALAAAHLDDDGVLVANTISARTGRGSRFFRAEYKTVKQVFPHVYAFPTADTPFLQNIEIVATKRAAGFSQADLRRLNQQKDVGVPLGDAIGRYQNASDIRTDDVPVLRDDYAPVDQLLQEQVGERYVVVETNETANASVEDAANASVEDAANASAEDAATRSGDAATTPAVG